MSLGDPTLQHRDGAGNNSSARAYSCRCCPVRVALQRSGTGGDAGSAATGAEYHLDNAAAQAVFQCIAACSACLLSALLLARSRQAVYFT
jgi:hypothetical protein